VPINNFGIDVSDAILEMKGTACGKLLVVSI
jgi:hypothetical protein